MGVLNIVRAGAQMGTLGNDAVTPDRNIPLIVQPRTRSDQYVIAKLKIAWPPYPGARMNPAAFPRACAERP